jgi:hypothetical protein
MTKHSIEEDTNQKPLGLKKSKNEEKDLLELYESALENYNENTEQSKLLFRGIVHECDKIVRISIQNDTRMDFLFYCIYANALYFLSFIDTNEPIEFLEIALEKAEIGLEMKSCGETLHCIARILIQILIIKSCTNTNDNNTIVDKDDDTNDNINTKQSTNTNDNINTNNELIKYLKETVNDFRLNHLQNNFDLFNEICQLIQQLIESSNYNLLEFNKTNFSSILELQENVDALIGLGNSFLFESERNENHNDLLKAVDLFQKALKLSNEPRINLLLGECFVNLGNIQEDDLSIEYYKKAVECFELIENDILPVEFKEFLDEWKSEMQ